MHASYTTVAGVDIAKDDLELAIHGETRTRRFANDRRGIDELVGFLRRRRVERLALSTAAASARPHPHALHDADLPVAMVNPARVREYARSLGRFAKNDRIDALLIARFAHDLAPTVRERPEPATRRRADLIARRRQLVRARGDEARRLAQAHDPEVAEDIREHIEQLDQRIERLEQRLERAMAEDPDAAATDRTLRSVKGVGPTVSRTLINELPELGRCSRRSIAALVGLAPYDHDSGRMRGRRSIRGGRAEVRAALYMATLSARRHNPVIREHFEQLRERGKAFKVAMVACMRKLLTYLNSLLAKELMPAQTP